MFQFKKRLSTQSIARSYFEKLSLPLFFGRFVNYLQYSITSQYSHVSAKVALSGPEKARSTFELLRGFHQIKNPLPKI